MHERLSRNYLQNNLTVMQTRDATLTAVKLLSNETRYCKFKKSIAKLLSDMSVTVTHQLISIREIFTIRHFFSNRVFVRKYGSF